MTRTSNPITWVAALGLLTLTAMTCRADVVDESTNTAVFTPQSPPFQPFTVGAQIGTTGYGGGVDWRFLNHFGVATAFDYLHYSYSGTIKSVPFNLGLRLQSEPLTLNLYPSKHSSFHFGVGALFNQNRLSGSANTAANPINLPDGQPYAGTLTLNIKQEIINPYLGIGGNLYFDSGHHVSIGGELGVIYTGDPRVSLTANPDSDPTGVQEEKNNIQHYAKDFQFWPVIKVSLNYSF